MQRKKKMVWMQVFYQFTWVIIHTWAAPFCHSKKNRVKCHFLFIKDKTINSCYIQRIQLCKLRPPKEVHFGEPDFFLFSVKSMNLKIPWKNRKQQFTSGFGKKKERMLARESFLPNDFFFFWTALFSFKNSPQKKAFFCLVVHFEYSSKKKVLHWPSKRLACFVFFSKNILMVSVLENIRLHFQEEFIGSQNEHNDIAMDDDDEDGVHFSSKKKHFWDTVLKCVVWDGLTLPAPPLIPPSKEPCWFWVKWFFRSINTTPFS